jgi:hypothetical protein
VAAGGSRSLRTRQQKLALPSQETDRVPAWSNKKGRREAGLFAKSNRGEAQYFARPGRPSDSLDADGDEVDVPGERLSSTRRDRRSDKQARETSGLSSHEQMVVFDRSRPFGEKPYSTPTPTVPPQRVVVPSAINNGGGPSQEARVAAIGNSSATLDIEQHVLAA